MNPPDAAMTAAIALANRNAAFDKALFDLGVDPSRAWGNYTLKQRVRSPAIGEKYERDYELAKAKYHSARALAQEKYLVALAALASPTPPGDSDAGLYD